jgi:hypothetical protein
VHHPASRVSSDLFVSILNYKLISWLNRSIYVFDDHECGSVRIGELLVIALCERECSPHTKVGPGLGPINHQLTE